MTFSATAVGPARNSPERPGLAYVRAVDAVRLANETVGDALVRLSNDRGNHPALIWLTDTGLGSMTWEALHRRSSTVASTLLASNPSRKRVALVAPNSVDWIVAMFGCALAGMSVVPISPSATNNEARHMLSQTRVGVVLAAQSVGELAAHQRMCEIAGQLSPRPIVRHISGWSAPTQAPSRAERVGPDDEFLLQHTSGTTGFPKAASLSHSAAMNCARVYAHACSARAGQRWLSPLPLHHVGASVTGVLAALSVGATYVVVERFTKEMALRAIREARPAILGLVPTMMVDLLDVPGVSASDFSSVRTVIGGASAVDPHLVEEMERRLKVTFLVGYGQSEAPAMALSARDDPVAVRTHTLGHCLPGRDYYICDRTGATLSTGSVGELCVRGPLIMSGYLRPDGSLDPAVDDAGWLHTGDLCSIDDQGVLTFRGRIREVIIRGGVNIYPAEVEHALATHEFVAEVAVFGVPDPRLGERVVGTILSRSGAHIGPDEMAEFAKSKLSQHKCPSEWIVASTLPRTSTGKVRKHLLRQWYEDGSLHARCGDLPEKSS